MSRMKAIVFQEEKNFDSLEIKEVEKPRPGPGEIRVKIKAAALNRRDVWITRGLYPKIRVPIILGSDGAGIVDKVGEGVDEEWQGKEVVINPALDWGSNPRVQQNSFRILGLPDNGTQAEYVIVPRKNVFEKPAHLTFEEAAAIPLGGLTAYRALFTQGLLSANETVLITGIGGGVATLMLLMARAARARVLVTSGSDEKIAKAVQLGASGGANYKEDNWVSRIMELAGDAGVDLVVDSAGGDGVDNLISIVKPGGRIVLYGATNGNPSKINLPKIYWRQITIQGSTMGTPEDFRQMVQYFGEAKIKPVVDGPYAMENFKKAYLRMVHEKQFGKIVIKIG